MRISSPAEKDEWISERGAMKNLIAFPCRTIINEGTIKSFDQPLLCRSRSCRAQISLSISVLNATCVPNCKSFASIPFELNGRQISKIGEFNSNGLGKIRSSLD
jgi:hypothetical protein